MCLNSSPLAALWECVGSTLSSLISSPVPSLKPQGQLLPTSGPVIYWAPLYCLWLPSGCLSGLRFSQTTASLRIIIRLRPAVWHASTHSLLLIELDPVQEVTEKWRVLPQRAMWLADLKSWRSAQDGRPACTGDTHVCLVSLYRPFQLGSSTVVSQPSATTLCMWDKQPDWSGYCSLLCRGL